MKVNLTLPDHVAERLRAMCHRRNMTASDLIARWVSGDLFGSPFKS